MPKRVIMRVEVFPEARYGFADCVKRNGSTNVVVMSRLIEWLTQQDMRLQVTILGLLPADEQRDTSREVMKTFRKR